MVTVVVTPPLVEVVVADEVIVRRAVPAPVHSCLPGQANGFRLRQQRVLPLAGQRRRHVGVTNVGLLLNGGRARATIAWPGSGMNR